MTCGVYWIRNKINSHIYIGSTTDVKRRRRAHKTELKRGVSSHKLLQDAVNEFGLKNFSYRVLITCHPDMRKWYEQQFLDQWNPEYNLQPRSDSSKGYKHSEESKKNMSLAHMGHHENKGCKFSEEARNNISLAHKGKRNNFEGHKHTEETKKKMSESQKIRHQRERNIQNYYKV